MTGPQAQPLLSPDGRFYWDGMEWRPVVQPPVVQPQPYYQPQAPVYPQPMAQYPQQPYYQAQQQFVGGQSNGAGTTAGVLGIIAVILMFIPVADFGGNLLGVLAVIFGIVGISRANRIGGVGKGMAITGLVLGLIAVLVSVIFIIAVYSYLFRGGYTFTG